MGRNMQLVPANANAARIVVEKDLEDYTVSVKVVDKNNKPLEGATVSLIPQLQATEAAVQEIITSKDGVAKFTDIDPNVYTVTAKQNDKLIAEYIKNAKGSKPILKLGLQEKKTPPNYWAFAIG